MENILEENFFLLLGSLKCWWVIHLETPSMDVPTYAEVENKDN